MNQELFVYNVVIENKGALVSERIALKADNHRAVLSYIADKHGDPNILLFEREKKRMLYIDLEESNE